MDDDKITGRIKMWQGRYGFIYSDQALKPDIYFHVSEVRKATIRLPLRPEQAIRYRSPASGKHSLAAFWDVA